MFTDLLASSRCLLVAARASVLMYLKYTPILTTRAPKANRKSAADLCLFSSYPFTDFRVSFSPENKLSMLKNIYSRNNRFLIDYLK